MKDALDTRHVVAATADMIFGSKIRGAAQQLGVPVRFARNAESLLEAACGARLVLLDLDARWLDIATAIRELKSSDRTAGAEVVAFVSHVRVDAIEAARAAGADRVLARSTFVRELPGLLQGGGRS
jgi:CheY-like chemotaxis protein